LLTLLSAATILTLAALSSHGAQSVTLAWDTSPEPDIAGYRVLYGTAASDLDQVIEAGVNTEITIFNLSERTEYFFAVTAYDSVGLESLPSEEVSITTHDSFAAWKTRAGVTDTAADSDLDGLAPVMEYALGLDAGTANNLPPPTVEDSALSITYPRDKYAADVTITPQVADSLDGPWKSGDANLIETVVADDGVIQTILVKDTVPISGTRSRFIRINVE
jgi:hypothetical protein